jgi:hypothetical protein
MAKTNGTLHIPGYVIEPRYIVRLQNGDYFLRAERGPDGSTDREHATQFLVRDGEWNADGWARRLNGTVEVAR